MAMLLLGTRNTATQTLAEGDLLDFGTIYRRYDKKGSCGYRAFESNGDAISLQHQGIYHLTALITFTGDVAGDAIFQLNENGIAIPGATATETITTATTEITTAIIDFYILVDSNCILNAVNTLKNITITNEGIATTITDFVVNIDKVV